MCLLKVSVCNFVMLRKNKFRIAELYFWCLAALSRFILCRIIICQWSALAEVNFFFSTLNTIICRFLFHITIRFLSDDMTKFNFVEKYNNNSQTVVDESRLQSGSGLYGPKLAEWAKAHWTSMNLDAYSFTFRRYRWPNQRWSPSPILHTYASIFSLLPLFLPLGGVFYLFLSIFSIFQGNLWYELIEDNDQPSMLVDAKIITKVYTLSKIIKVIRKYRHTRN